MRPPPGLYCEELMILLVEDNPSDVELSLHALRKSGLANTVHVVRDGAEALDYLFRRNEYANRNGEIPVLILLDMNLPKMDGIEVLQEIKSNPRTREIPVIVLTSSVDERHISESRRLGVTSYILKPLDIDRFVDNVRCLGFSWMLVSREK